MVMRASLVVLLASVTVASCALFAVDLGSQNMKIAMLRQGRDIEVVLNEASKRKSPTLVHVAEDGERMYGDAAVSKLATRPKITYAFLSRLLGHGLDSPMVEFVKELNYPYNFSEDEERHTLLVDYQGDKKFYVEELVGMMLTYARDLASFAAESRVRDVVIAVPPFYTQAERQSVLDAAALAGLKVLSLVNDNTAVAVEYGIQKKDREAGAYNVMMIDMGASKTTASVVKYTLKEKSIGGKNKTTSQFDVIGEAWDTHLGGMNLDACLTRHFATEFNKKLKGENVFEIPRAFAKLRGEAEKAKMVLSANKDAHVHVEGLYDDIDFKLQVSRTQFEELCGDVFARIPPVLENALKSANITAEDLTAVELFGGSTRVPKVKTLIEETLSKELSHSLNTDEAAVMGATFFAANVSSEFRVRNYQMSDWNPYAVGVQLVETVEGAADSETSDEKKLSGTLFGRGKPFPSTKVVTVKRFEDFAFDIYYSDQDMLPEGAKDTNIARLHVNGMSAVKDANITEGAKPKVQVTFRQNFDGVISIAKAEVSYNEDYVAKEKVCRTVNVTDDEPAAAPAADADAAEAEAETEAEKKDGDEEAAEGEAEGAETPETPKEDADAEPAADDKKEDDSTPEEGEATANGTDAAANSTETAKPKTKRECEHVEKVKTRTRKVQLSLDRAHTGFVKGLDKNSTKELRSRLDEMDQNDIRRRERANASNKLEAQIYEWRDKMTDETVQKFCTEEEREKLSKLLTENEDYLYDVPEATLDDYLGKIELVEEITNPIVMRMREADLRSDAVEEFRESLDKFRGVLPGWKENRTQITDEERDIYSQMVDDVEKWINGKVEEQEAKATHEDPAFQVSELKKKLKPLAQEKKRLERKPKPKPPKVDKANNSTSTDNSTTTEEKPEVKVEATDEESADGSSDKAEATGESNEETEADANDSKDEKSGSSDDHAHTEEL